MSHVLTETAPRRRESAGPRSFGVAVPVLLACLAGGFGCAVSDPFLSHPGHMAGPLRSLRSGGAPGIEAPLTKLTEGRNRELYLLESGRLAQLTGRRDTSRQYYASCIDAIRAREDGAVIRAGDAAATGTAMAVNDLAIPYEARSYEEIMLLHFQAENFLMDGDPRGALVEFRRADAAQRRALERRDRSVEKARSTAASKGIATAEAEARVSRAYAGMDEAAGAIKNSFQNAYTFYLGGVCYEILDQANDAYIDYKQALELTPGNPFLQRDAIRLADRLAMTQDAAELKQRFPEASAAVSAMSAPHGGGELILFFEDELVPQKEELKLPIPIMTHDGIRGFTMMAVPLYNNVRHSDLPLEVSVPNSPPDRTWLLSRPSAMAVKALREEAIAIGIRQAIRSVAKGAAVKVSDDKAGAWAAWLITLFNLVSERADLRSWTTLPATVHVLRRPIPSGNYPLVLRHPPSGAEGRTEISVKPGTTVVAVVTRVGRALYVRDVALRGTAGEVPIR